MGLKIELTNNYYVKYMIGTTKVATYLIISAAQTVTIPTCENAAFTYHVRRHLITPFMIIAPILQQTVVVPRWTGLQLAFLTYSGRTQLIVLIRSKVCKSVGTWCCKRSVTLDYLTFPIMNDPNMPGTSSSHLLPY